MDQSRIGVVVLVVLCFGTIDGNTAWSQQTEIPEGQLWYDKVVRLRDGSVIRDVEVSYESKEGQYERYSIKSRDGSIIRKLPSEIIVIETHSRAFYPPQYNPIDVLYPCDDRQRELHWYFVEARGWAYVTSEDESQSLIGIDRYAVGPEVALGYRFHPWGIGLGTGYFNSRSIARVPVFLHVRYQLSAHCFAPFLYSQLGTVFDDQSDTQPAVSNMLKPAPKLLGIGVGIDWPLNEWMDVSVDVGYRYMQLPTKLPCDCSDKPETAEAVFFNESHGVLVRIGITL